VTGEGPPLVLVHGSATDLTTWDGVIDELARVNRVIVYDRRSYGQSSHKDPHPFGVMHEHIPMRSVAAMPVPIT